MSELVSVIITTYKRSADIVFRAIDSVINQTYPNIEIIVVDDSPSNFIYRDTIKSQIVKYSEKVIYIQHESNKGACAARNTGLSVASGYYVAFLDDDDEWLPEKIYEQIKKFQDQDTGLVYCGKVVINDSTGDIKEDILIEHTGYIYDRLIFNNFIGSTSFPIMKKSVLVDVGGFDPMMKSAQDYDTWLRIAKKYKVECVSKPLVKYHIHEGERISTNHAYRISGQELLIQKNIDYLKQHPKAWAWRNLRLALQYSKALQLDRALKLWITSLTKQPFDIVTNIKYFLYIFYYYFKEKRKS